MVQDTQTCDGARHQNPWWCKTPKPAMMEDTKIRDGARHPKPAMVQDTQTRDGAKHQKPVMVQDTKLD